MIRLCNLNFGYGRRRKVIDHLTLDLPSGEIVGLMGSNGTGKSTLLKLLAGLLDPDSGTIEAEGIAPASSPLVRYRRLMFVPEEFDLPAVTLDRFVQVTAPFYPAFSADTFADCCRRLDVERDRRLDTLSMGQRKKGYLAFALACNLPVLLLDEPTNGLDIPARSTLRSLLAAYAAPDRTVIVSTHSARDIEQLVDRVVLLDRQRLLLSERVDRLAARFGFGRAGEHDAVLYAEPSIGGTAAVWIASEPDEGRFDLELFFNAALHAPDAVIAALKQPAKTSDHAAQF